MTDGWTRRHAPDAGDTIFAVSTPPGRSAVAVIRVSGPRAGDVVALLAGKEPQPRVATYASFRDPMSGEVLDRGLVLHFPAPASFTGEDCAEFQVHGSAATVRGLCRTLSLLPGLRVAKAGEFTERAFANGKIALDEVEALADLIDAQTDRQRRLALRALETGPVRLAEEWRTTILDVLAEIDARLDFSDEGDVDGFDPAVLPTRLASLAQRVEETIAATQRAAKIRDGFVVALCGPPNAGKSTLLNALAGSERAIVSPHPGTTRDTIEVPLELDGCLVTLCDTAGIWDTPDPVEAIGVARARTTAAQADLRVWLEAPDASGPPDMPVDLRIATKSDLAMPTPDGAIAISTRTGQGLDVLLATIAGRATGAAGEGGSAAALRERHLGSAAEIAANVREAGVLAARDKAEMAAATLRTALASLETFGSMTADEDVLDRIFGRFCIGK